MDIFRRDPARANRRSSDRGAMPAPYAQRPTRPSRVPTPSGFVPALALAAAFAAPAFSALTLTQIPAGMRKQNADITVGWAGGQGRVHLRASTVPGGAGASISHYDSLHLPSQVESGSYTFKVNPDIPSAYRNTDLRYGVNYCIVTDGKSASPEFSIILESSKAPVLTSPANAASIKDLTPVFSWSGDAPYYALLVSDEPFKIGEDGTVSGVSAIWQIITPYASARYGETDPSGFNTVPAPPLISGKTYNWLVLNNYGNNSAATSKVAPVPASFTYLPSPPLPAAALIEPKDKDTIPGADRIVFRWALVEGAVSYKLELLEENLVDGSQADVSLWKGTSTGGQLALDNAGSLLRRFNYKWRVYAVGGNGAASLSDKRSFFYAVDVGDINIFVKDQAGRKLAYAPVKVNRLGGSSSAVYQGGSTDAEGSLSIKNAPLGSYEIRVENVDGYQPKTDTLQHASKSGSSRNLVLAPALGKLVGKASKAADGTGILNARVAATGTDGSQWSALTNSQGNYSLSLPYGIWQIKVQADGYAAATGSASLSSSAPARTADFRLAANPYTLSGTVRNSFTRQGLFGATAQLALDGQIRTANTDGNGNFSFSVPAGSASLRLSCPGFASPEPLSLSLAGDRALVIDLDPNASILSGRTRDPSGTGIPGALVTATPKAGPVRTALADNQGYFELSLPAGDWSLEGSAKGYTSQTTRKFLLDASKTVQGVDFSFAPNLASISGRVTVNGAGLAGATVASGEAKGITDNAGYYRLSVGAGTRTVIASREGYLIPKVWALPVNSGDALANVDFAATGNAGILKGRVLSGGAGMVGAVVKAANKATREAFTQTTDGTGAFALSLPGAEYELTAVKEGFAPDAAISLVLPPGATVLDQNLRMVADQGALSGLVSSGSAPLSGCEMGYRAATDASLAGKTMTDPQGRYTLSLQAGTAYLLTAACPGYQTGNAEIPPLARGSSGVQDFNLAPAGAIYKGRAVDAAGKPVAGAKATAEKSGSAVSILTDFDGGFAFNLGAGAYSLTVSKTGYRSASRTLSLALGSNAGPADTLKSSTGRLAGRVLSDGSPVAGALLVLSGATAGAGSGIFAADAEGRYAGDALPAGNYSLTATAEGYSEARIASLTIAEGKLTTADLALTADRGILQGAVTADGLPAADATVAATAYGVARSARTGADGKFRIDRLPAGSYSVSATLPGYAADKAYEGKALAAGGALAGLDFAMSRNSGSLAGTISGASNSAGIRVAVAGTRRGARGYAQCDAAGKYAIPSLPADDYAVTVTASGYRIASGSQTPVIAITSARQYDISLVPAVFKLTGQILNQAGTGIPSMPVELRAGSEEFRTATGADGAYSFADVPAGQEYRLACRPPTSEYDPKDTVFALPLDAPAAATADLRTLSRNAVLAGTVTLDGAPVEGAGIRVSGNGNALTALSQPGGPFKLSGIAGSPRPLAVSVSKAGAGIFDTSLILNVGETATGLAFRLKTVKLGLSASLTDSEGKTLAGAKVIVAYGKRLDTLKAAPDGKVNVADLPANQALTFATLLDKEAYDNREIPVFLGERDTSLDVRLAVHATTIMVRVKDQTGADVDGADVQMNGKALGRTAQGRLSASKLPRGSYAFLAGKSGYRSGSSSTLAVSGDTAASIELVLTKVTGGVYGTVRDTGLDPTGPGGVAVAAARALPGAIVIVSAGADTLRDTVNELGQYAVDGLAEGRKYGLSVSLPGYGPRTDSVTAAIQPQEKDLILTPFPGSVLGRVDGGRSGVRVQLTHPASGRFETFLTRYGGYYAFTGLRHRQDYLVQALDGANSSAAAAFQADGATAARHDPVLGAWGAVRGKVTGTSGNPLAGAMVTARNALNGGIVMSASDSSGAYAVAGLPSGRHAISVSLAGYRPPAPVTLEIAKGAAATADFRLEATVEGIAGVVMDGEGRAVASTVILAGGGDTLRAEAGGDGRFAFGGLAAGPYVLGATRIGYADAGPLSVDYAGKGLENRVLTLARRKRSVIGAVRDALTDAPLAGATVQVSGGATAVADSAGRFEVATPAGAVRILLSAALDGYLPRAAQEVYLDTDGSALQDIALAADYRFDGRINVLVKEGKDPVEGLFISLQSFHPDDAAAFSVSGAVASSFRDLRRPVAYALKVKREGYKDLSKVVELKSGAATLDVILSYPTSRLRLFVTSDGKRGRDVEAFLDGRAMADDPDTSGLFPGEPRLKAGRYEISLKDPDAGLIPMSPYSLDLGEDSVRTDTLIQPFYAVPIADSVIGGRFLARVRRVDSLRPASAVTCTLYYRLKGESIWNALALDSAAGGFADTVPALSRAGTYEYFFALRSPAGARAGIVTGGGEEAAAFPLSYSGIQSPASFSLRDPYLLQSFSLTPARLEADTSLYSLGARDVFQAQMKGENGRSLDGFFDERAAAGDGDFAVAWSFAEPERAKIAGLALQPVPGSPRMVRFEGGMVPSDTVFRIDAAVRMGDVRLTKSFRVKIQDLVPVSVGIRYVKENRVLEADGAALALSNRNAAGYAFSAFAATAEGRVFNILPHWSLGEDSAAGNLTQQGVFFPDSAVARNAALHIRDTLRIGATQDGRALYAAYHSVANLSTLARVNPASDGRTTVTDGEGAVLDFNLAGLSKSFTVSVRKPKVSGLLRASAKEEVVGRILDIELSESQPFKADSGAVLKLPVGEGIARRRKVYLGHWNSSLLAWEKVDSASAASEVAGTVHGFSKYAVLMGSLPLGAYDLTLAPNPFSSDDPWGLQLGYKVSSDVSSLVGVRVEVYNMMGDKVYESEETQLNKGETIAPGAHKAAPGSAERRSGLGPYVWDGRDTRGTPCRNGRYLLKLIVRDGRGSKEYLRKVVMLK